MMKKILIIEDDPAILIGLESALEEYELISSTEGADGLIKALDNSIDLIILDIMLPIMNGFDICKELRKKGLHTPIIMLTSKKEEADKVFGFETGADDYVTKPFSINELKMRIKALLRRAEMQTTSNDSDSYKFSNIIVEYKKLDAFRSGIALGLSAKEFQILKYFVEHESEVISRDKLLDDIWGYDNYPTTRTVDNYILSLRKKIEIDSSNPRHILTVHTVGYKFVK